MAKQTTIFTVKVRHDSDISPTKIHRMMNALLKHGQYRLTAQTSNYAANVAAPRRDTIQALHKLVDVLKLWDNHATEEQEMDAVKHAEASGQSEAYKHAWGLLEDILQAIEGTGKRSLKQIVTDMEREAEPFHMENPES